MLQSWKFLYGTAALTSTLDLLFSTSNPFILLLTSRHLICTTRRYHHQSSSLPLWGSAALLIRFTLFPLLLHLFLYLSPRIAVFRYLPLSFINRRITTDSTRVHADFRHLAVRPTISVPLNLAGTLTICRLYYYLYPMSTTPSGIRLDSPLSFEVGRVQAARSKFERLAEQERFEAAKYALPPENRPKSSASSPATREFDRSRSLTPQPRSRSRASYKVGPVSLARATSSNPWR